MSTIISHLWALSPARGVVHEGETLSIYNKFEGDRVFVAASLWLIISEQRTVYKMVDTAISQC